MIITTNNKWCSSRSNNVRQKQHLKRWLQKKDSKTYDYVDDSDNHDDSDETADDSDNKNDIRY